MTTSNMKTAVKKKTDRKRPEPVESQFSALRRELSQIGVSESI